MFLSPVVIVECAMGKARNAVAYCLSGIVNAQNADLMLSTC
jgi:hypothetical protein